MTDLLQVPAFARLADYVGLWSMSPQHFSGLWSMAQRIDLAAHVEEGPPPLKSVLEKIPGPGDKSIAVVKMTGLLMKSQSSMGGTSTIQLRREIRAAAADPEVAGILLAVDSPGGTVAGTDDLATDVKAARRAKPVWAHIDDLGASAAYWAISAANRIVANSPTALVGSIGTIQVVRDFSAAAEREGIRTLVFATGSLKGLGTPGTKVTDEQAEHLQSLVDAVQLNFDSAVQKGRSLGVKELAAVRHGGVMTATEAMDKRLVDAVQPLSKTLSEFSRELSGRTDHGRAAAGSLPMLRRGLPMLTG